MNEPCGVKPLLKDKYITHLMLWIWRSREDLQRAFDLETEAGQKRFVRWCIMAAPREYGVVLDPNSSYPFSFLERWAARFFTRHARKNRYGTAVEPVGVAGANLIGYAQAELGMGEHVRMSAAALENTDIAFGVQNFSVGLASRQQAQLEHGQSITSNIYAINLFHINADQMLQAYCHLGAEFFSRRYNIGHWAWELEKFPDAWTPAIDLMDEVWAQTKFIQSAVAEKSSKPVEYMPVCVTLPSFSARDRASFGLPEDVFLFLFVFDFLSFIDRKNPLAAIRSFKAAFPDRSSAAGLVIKAMNGDAANPKWQEMMALIDGDPRIYVINQTIRRTEVLALMQVCDCFLSLHRSEGFGRGIAEAMLLGKPVVVTNYSGNTDFTRAQTACLVNYKLIPVEAGQYPCPEGQVWADADVTHAAWHMKRLVEDADLAKTVGLRGQAFIQENYSPEVVGAAYAKRLKQILASN